MLCRGEFNFIVASFALSAGVLDPEQYAAVVFAILCSAVVAPLALSKIIKYYNNKFQSFLEGKHRLDRIDSTNDGTRPLFLAIQARTPVQWGMQEKFLQALENVGLLVIDHRSFHTLGLNAVDVTEIFCQDKITRVRIPEAFNAKTSNSTIVTRTSTFDESPQPHARSISKFPTIQESPSREQMELMLDLEEQEQDRKERQEIDLRKRIVRDALVDCLGRDVDESTYVILVSQWEMHVIDDSELGQSRHAGYRFVMPAATAKGALHELEENSESSGKVGDHDDDLPILPSLDVESQPSKVSTQEPRRNIPPSLTGPTARFHRRTVSMGTHSDLGSVMTDEPKLDLDLWNVDEGTHKVVNEGFFMEPVDDLGTRAFIEGCGDGSSGGHHRRCRTTGGDSMLTARAHRRTNREETLVQNASTLDELGGDIEALTIKDRLHGFIRH